MISSCHSQALKVAIIMLHVLLSQNGKAFFTTLGGAVAYVGACGLIGKLGVLPARLARKLMHIGVSGCEVVRPPCCFQPSRSAAKTTRQRTWQHSSTASSPSFSQCAGTGPLFMLCWPLYSPGAHSRWLAASVPALAGLQFALVGAGIVKDDTLVAGASVSRGRLLQSRPCHV
jgi:phytol kinase